MNTVMNNIIIKPHNISLMDFSLEKINTLPCLELEKYTSLSQLSN